MALRLCQIQYGTTVVVNFIFNFRQERGECQVKKGPNPGNPCYPIFWEDIPNRI